MYSMNEVLQTILENMIDNDGLDHIKDVLSDYNLICIDPDDQNIDWELVFGNMFQ